MKKILMFFVLLLTSFSCFAECDYAPPTTDPAFCEGFRKSAICHCTVEAPKGTPCTNIGLLYQLIIAKFKTQDAACQYAAKNASPKRPTAEQCNREWNCYRLGGAGCYAKCM